MCLHADNQGSELEDLGGHSRTSVDNVLKAEGDINSGSDPVNEVLMDPAPESESDEEGEGGEEEGGGGGSDA